MGAGTDVDTRKVARRDVHFERIDDLLADVDGLGSAPVTAGNWSAPEIVQHVALVIDASLDGFVGRAPRYLRLIVPLFKKRVLTKPMPAGLKIPATIERIAPDPATTWSAAVEHLRNSVRRFREQDRLHPSPLLGALSHNEWEQLHCRHAEMHFSFLMPRG